MLTMATNTVEYLPMSPPDLAVELDDSSFASLDDSFKETDYDHGRNFSTRCRNRHPFPVDACEQERQRRQFDSYYKLFQGRLCPASATAARSVLDVNTGAGCWAIEFAAQYPSSRVWGIDTVYMQEKWVTENCDFYLERSLHQPEWYYPYKGVDLIHIGTLWGDRQLLACLLDGAYDCCSPGGTVEMWDSTVHFPDPHGEGPLHRLYKDMREAYRIDGRSLDLPKLYLSEMEDRGFVEVAEHVRQFPLSMNVEEPARSVLESWADGLEAYSLELLVKHLGKRDLDVLLSCATARQALRRGEGVEGFLQM
ncbi:hypothetical protein BDV59DRAFT_188933 [Aspergillus ambiguus]|uniref:uncharacterized protein n=1 Tax=Aspergillus ambiguus TaxID=176160 RepID=UPI003CCD0A03